MDWQRVSFVLGAALVGTAIWVFNDVYGAFGDLRVRVRAIENTQERRLADLDTLRRMHVETPHGMAGRSVEIPTDTSTGER
jgi:hypothetical protein